MNRYGALAMKHWREEFPNRFSQIEDPQRFFTELGAQVSTEIADLAAELAAQEPSSGTFLANLGNQRTSTSRAEEIVLAQRVYLTEETDESDSSQPAQEQSWTPLVEDPSDPWWQAERDSGRLE
ncbi:hypothetical protein [Hamadaea tsunoensis]|uniref:hypothetical protein n=1 Tax=Hamadaea tsunoensis TaxID=53368 RepID=UPI00040498A1|nr:hypothetical protein [Hamadaea tsunoensis]